MVILQLLLSTTVNQIGVLKSGSQIRRCFSPPTSCFDIYSKSHCIFNVSLLSTTFCIESREVYRREKKKHRGAFMQINGFPSWQLQAMVSKGLFKSDSPASPMVSPASSIHNGEPNWSSQVWLPDSSMLLSSYQSFRHLQQKPLLKRRHPVQLDGLAQGL
ncbi:hypothetical protein F2Q69_00054290 [Brassica cretica]|uniref:Uncharacterized protein n=1 Tax=Brassica cretica TaxID=69181 RepID=A0A8S9MXU6_BRACR|nr:hypothetical protein F2Q69_00054290 [Brassica cretica]